MRPPPKPRKRAVHLTPEALGALRKALAERWQENARTGRLTHEARAEMMGVSVATAKNILSGAGADRSSFALVFKNLGLAWNDDFCESPAQEEEPPPDEPKDLPVEPEPLPNAPEPRTPDRRLLVAALGFLALLGLVAAFVARRPSPDAIWQGEFNRAIANAEGLYHKAEYVAARKEAERGFAIARAHDSAGRMAYALHLQGDLEGARGRLRDAKDCYEREVSIRRTEMAVAHLPRAYEALGEVETRLKEYPGAQKNLELALVGYRRKGDRYGVASVQRHMGSVFLGTGDLDAADDWLQKSLDGLRTLGQPATEVDVRGRMALVLLARGRPDEARTILRDCLAYWTKEGHARWIALIDMQLGLAEERLHDAASARTRIARSREAFARVGDEARVAEAEEHLRRLGSPSPR